MRWLVVILLLLTATLTACGGDAGSGELTVHDAWSLPVSLDATQSTAGVDDTSHDHDDMDDVDDSDDDASDDHDDDDASDGHDDDDAHDHNETGSAEMHGGATAAVFFTIDNDSDEDDRLVGVQTDIADVAEMHFSEIDDAGVMRMNPVDGVEIPAGESVEFESGGYHVMLIGLHEDLVPGKPFEITLEFAEHGDIDVEVDIRQP